MAKLDWRRAKASKPTELESDRSLAAWGTAPSSAHGGALSDAKRSAKFDGLAPRVTQAEIEGAKSRKGGFTRDALAKWGVPWPPPKGWRQALVNGHVIPGTTISAVPQRKDKPVEAALLHQVVMAVITAGQGQILSHLPDVVAFYGAKLPTVAEVIGGRPAHAVLEGGVTFDDKVYKFSYMGPAEKVSAAS